MSAGFAVMDPTPYNDGSGSGASNGGGGGGYTEEDLLASLAGFGVEGQTERDLATIKAMFAAAAASAAGSSTGGFHLQHPTYHNNVNSNSSGSNGNWYTAYSGGGAGFGYGGYSHSAQQPPPNTPTLSKSLELQGLEAAMMQQHSGGGAYFNHGFGNGAGGSSSRRRDVSLDRDTVRTLQSSDGSASTSSVAMDMDMGDDAEPHHHQRHYHDQQQATPSRANGGASHRRPSIHLRNPSVGHMGDIAEEVEQQQQSQYEGNNQAVPSGIAAVNTSASTFTNGYPPSTLQQPDAGYRISSPAIVPPEKGTRRSNPSSPVPAKADPPVTRSRSRMQQSAPAYSSTSYLDQ